MLLSYNHLVSVILEGRIIRGSAPEFVNQSSIDIRLGKTIKVECPLLARTGKIVSLADRDKLETRDVDIEERPYLLHPGEFILAHSMETFYLPNHISAEYKMKSSMARIGLNHLTACWCDAGWTGSNLTMELKNETRHHTLEIRAGDRIGQMVFFVHEQVPHDRSYAQVGRYNHDAGVCGIKP